MSKTIKKHAITNHMDDAAHLSRVKFYIGLWPALGSTPEGHTPSRFDMEDLAYRYRMPF